VPGGLEPFSVNRENFSHLPPIATRNGSFCTFRIDGAFRRSSSSVMRPMRAAGS